MSDQGPDSNQPVKSTTRRSLLAKLWALVGFIALAELFGLVFAFLRPEKKIIRAAGQDPVIVAGPVESFEPGTVTAFIQGKFYLARLADGGFIALSRTCTHLGCTVPWVAAENKFICPCHSSQFDITGEVIKPPAPRAMDIYPVVIENNVIRVDTTSRRKRSRFEAGQLTYPKKG